MTDSELTGVFEEIKYQYEPARSYRVQASFYPYRGIKHTIRLRDNTLHVRVSGQLRQAPPDIFGCLGHILFQKMFYRKVQPVWRKNYDLLLQKCTLPTQQQSPPRPDNYFSQGKHYDLKELFDQLNQRFFQGRLKEPRLGWSQKKSYRRLGFYDSERNLLVVTRLLDKRRTPRFVVEYIVYHEMLHIVHPVQKRPGKRRLVHSAEFRRDEEKFPDIEKARRWIKRHFSFRF